MNRILALLVAIAGGSILVACGSSSSGSGANGSCTHPTSGSTNPDCSACAESACSSQFSTYCSSDCSTNASSSSCQSAAESVASCIASSCASQCALGQGAGGSGQGAGGSGQGVGGSGQGVGGQGAGGSVMPTGNCASLDTCCMTLSGTLKDNCSSVASSGIDASCSNLLMSLQSGHECTSSNTVAVSCYYADMGFCSVQNVPMAQKSLYEMGCTSATGGTLEPCPTANVVGCCQLLTTESCSYTNAASGDVETQDKCTAMGGNFSTTP